MEPPKEQAPSFQFAKLKRSGRRPTFERAQENYQRLEQIPEESESRIEDLSRPVSDLSEYDDAEDETTAEPSSSSIFDEKSVEAFDVSPETLGQSHQDTLSNKTFSKNSTPGSFHSPNGEIAPELNVSPASSQDSDLTVDRESFRNRFLSWQTARSSDIAPGLLHVSPASTHEAVAQVQSYNKRSSSLRTEKMNSGSRKESLSSNHGKIGSSGGSVGTSSLKFNQSPKTSLKKTPGSNVALKSLPYSEYGLDSGPTSQKNYNSPQSLNSLFDQREKRKESLKSTNDEHISNSQNSEQSPQDFGDQFSIQHELSPRRRQSVKSSLKKSITPELSSRKNSKRPSFRSRISSRRTSIRTRDDFDFPLPPPPSPNDQFSPIYPPSRVKEAANSIPSSRRSFSKKSRRSAFSTYSILEEDDEEVGYLPEKRNSIQFPVLEDREKYFHELVIAGDVEAVKKFLREVGSFNLNCVSYEVRLLI